MKVVPVTIKFVRSFPLPKWAVAKVPLRRLILWRYSWAMEAKDLAHELCHITQAERHPGWPLPYLVQWIAHGFQYKRMPFEVEARRAESEPFYLSWAREVLKGIATPE